MATFLLKFKFYFGLILAAVVGVFVAYLSGKSQAEDEAKASIAEKDKEIDSTKAVAAAEVQASSVAKETSTSVSRASPSDVDKQLSDSFTRD